jgi:hypothetical protein
MKYLLSENDERAIYERVIEHCCDNGLPVEEEAAKKCIAWLKMTEFDMDGLSLEGEIDHWLDEIYMPGSEMTYDTVIDAGALLLMAEDAPDSRMYNQGIVDGVIAIMRYPDHPRLFEMVYSHLRSRQRTLKG